MNVGNAWDDFRCGVLDLHGTGFVVRSGNGGSGPSHALQKSTTVDAVVIAVVSDKF
jgi:hypothetical protein